MAAAEQRLNAFERAFSEELQMQKTAGHVKTAADQIDEILAKMSMEKCSKCGGSMEKEGEITKCSKCSGSAKTAAAIDGAELMGKLNPVGRTFKDAKSFEEGLRKVESEKFGGGVEAKTSPDRTMIPGKLEQFVTDPAIFSAESGGQPVRPSIGKPKVGADRLLQAAAMLTAKRQGIEKDAYFYLKRDREKEPLTVSPMDEVARPEWEREISQKKREHFENFMSMAESKKGKPLTEDEATALVETYNKATGSKVPLPKDWNHGHVPWHHFEKNASGGFPKAAEDRQTVSVSVPRPGKLTTGQKVGLLAGGALLAGGGTGAGLYLAGKGVKAERRASTAMENVRAAGKNVASEAVRIGKGVEDASASLSSASQDVKKVLAPAVAAVEKGQQAKKRVQDVVEEISSKAKSAPGKVRETVKSVSEKIPAGTREKIISAVSGARGQAQRVGGVLKTLLKRADAVGGLPKAAGDAKDQYVDQVGRSATAVGGQLGATGGGIAGGMGGAYMGARQAGMVGGVRGVHVGASKARTAKGALVGGALGAIGGALVGGAGGAVALRGIARHKASQLRPSQRRAAEEFNKAHDSFVSGKTSRDQYSASMKRFMASQGRDEHGRTKTSSLQEEVQKLASEGKIRTLEEWRR